MGSGEGRKPRGNELVYSHPQALMTYMLRYLRNWPKVESDP